MPKQQYETVADKLRALIGPGRKYPPGAKLPSRRKLAEMFECSDTVIDKAMWILRREGLTETLPGVAVYVREDIGG